MVAAIAKTGVRLAGSEVPSIPSLYRQILLGIVGLAVFVVGVMGNPFEGRLISNKTTPTSTTTTLSAPSTTTSSSSSTSSTVPPTPVSRPAVTCTAFETMDALVRLSRNTAPRGAPVTVTGTGFCPGDLIDLYVHMTAAGNPVTPDARGSFTATITIPSSTPPFTTDIRAQSRTHRGTASAPFTVS